MSLLRAGRRSCSNTSLQQIPSRDRIPRNCAFPRSDPKPPNPPPPDPDKKTDIGYLEYREFTTGTDPGRIPCFFLTEGSAVIPTDPAPVRPFTGPSSCGARFFHVAERLPPPRRSVRLQKREGMFRRVSRQGSKSLSRQKNSDTCSESIIRDLRCRRHRSF